MSPKCSIFVFVNTIASYGRSIVQCSLSPWKGKCSSILWTSRKLSIILSNRLEGPFQKMIPFRFSFLKSLWGAYFTYLFFILLTYFYGSWMRKELSTSDHVQPQTPLFYLMWRRRSMTHRNSCVWYHLWRKHAVYTYGRRIIFPWKPKF